MTSNVRRYDLDALKVVGTFLIFLFHCIQPFNPFDQWHLSNSMRSSALGTVNAFLNIWIMPLFMLLAGSSSYYALQKKSYLAYLKERVFRILIPCVFGILVLVPPQVYWERIKKGQFHGHFFQFYPHFFEGIYPSGNFSWHHLWFLVYLFTYSILGLFFFRLFRKPIFHTMIHRLAGSSKDHIRTWIIFLLPSLFFQVLFGRRYPQTNAFVGDWAWHAQLFLAFLWGYIFAMDKRFFEAFGYFWKASGLLAMGMCILVLNVSAELLEPLSRAILYRIASWAWILATLGFGFKFMNYKSTVLSYAARAAFPFYILHQTVIIGLCFWILDFEQAIFVKFSLIFALSFLLTLGVYALLRQIKFFRLLMGLKD